jgi:hypothetical protein
MSDLDGQLASLLRHLAQNSARKPTTFSKVKETKLKQIETHYPNQVETNPTPSGITSNAVVAGHNSNLVKYIGHFCDHGDGTVSDTRTGLMWMRAAMGQEWDGQACTGKAKLVGLQEAISIHLDFAGYKDWRLPTITELEEIVRDTQDSGLDRFAFPNQSGRRFWSSSKKIDGDGKHYSGQAFFSGYSLVLTLRNGEVGFSDPDTGYEYVRLVRRGSVFSIATTTIGVGYGAVLRSPDADNYFFGSSVTLTAQASAGSKFVGWRGDATGRGATCTVSMNSSKNVSAEFAPLESYLLSALSIGTGSGNIERSLVAEQYVEGDLVTLIARANTGSKFKCWHGDASGRGSKCEVTMDSSKEISAEFVALDSFPLIVNVTGTGGGTIDRSFDSPSYYAGTKVTLTASADVNSTFNGWHGDADLMDDAITVTMDSAFSINAEFVALESFLLNVNATGSGSGQIKRSSDASSYFDGTTITLTATADEGSIFYRWRGDATGIDKTLAVTFNSDFSIEAEFIKINITDTEIKAKLTSVKRAEIKRGQLATTFNIEFRNTGKEQARIRVPLTSYVSQSGQTSEQSSWAVGQLNGSKGITLAAGTFCEMGLVHSTQLANGDKLCVVVEYVQSPARISFTYQYINGLIWLIHSNLENVDEGLKSKVVHPKMADALKRIDALENTLAEVLRRLDAIQPGSKSVRRDVAQYQIEPVQTLPEIWAWVAKNERISVAQLRASLLPLDLLPSAAMDELNERALDLTGEIALTQVGDEIIVTSAVIDEVLTNWNVGLS